VVTDKSLRVLCLDATTGQTLNDIEVFRKDSLWKIHRKNSHATPTPVIVDDRCYVHFGSHGTAALDLKGAILWKTELDYYHHHGPAGCPVIVAGAAVIACDGFIRSYYDNRIMTGVTDPQFVVALETATGKVRWKRKRDGGTHSYATPLVIEVNGRTQVVAPGGNGVVAYDPATGEEIWSCRYQGYSVVPRPVYGHGLVFICTGYDVPQLLAIRPDGTGDVTDTHVAWKATQTVPLNPSPLLVGDYLFLMSDQGVVSCLDAKTGKVLRRRRVGGNHSASPIFADGRLYFLDEVGATTVIAPDTECRILARNIVRGKTQASLAVSGRALFLRSDTHLYRIEEIDPHATGDDALSVDETPETGEAKPHATNATPEK
jgi:outer membrane protein assembly factor BamB